MKKLRVGVIGLGMGKAHINGYKAHPQADVACVADTDKDRLKYAETELGIKKTYTDALEMIAKENLDVVSVVVPNKLHRELTIAALESGCDVLCEKPMAMNAVEAEEMVTVAERCGRRLATNFSYRFNPQSQAMKKMVESGDIGDVYFGRTVWHRRRGMPGFGGWFGTKAMSGGGPLIDLGVHRLDLALWLMGYPEPEWVIGSTYDHIAKDLAARACRNFDVEDMACAMIKFANGATLELEASWAANIKERDQMSTRLLGSKGGMFQYNLDEGYKFHVECYLEKQNQHYDMSLHPPVEYTSTSECHDSYYSFIDAIIEDKPYLVAPNEGVTVMKLLDAIYESAATGAPVKL